MSISPMTIKGRTLYVLKRIHCQDEYYVRHGEVGGVPDAVGCAEKQYARRFLSGKDAQEFLNQKIPAWARDCFEVEPICKETDGVLFWPAACQAAFWAEETTEDMLNPAGNRLLLWRR